MACDESYDGIPIPTSLLQWTGGTLQSVDLSQPCKPKLNEVILSLDQDVYSLRTRGLLLTGVNGGAIVDSTADLYLIDYLQELGLWSTSVANSIAALQEPFQLATAELPLNLSCLVGANCATPTVTLLSALEVIIARVCRHDADIARIKDALTGDFDTGTIYVPST